jgi:hypothetical protein
VLPQTEESRAPAPPTRRCGSLDLRIINACANVTDPIDLTGWPSARPREVGRDDADRQKLTLPRPRKAEFLGNAGVIILVTEDEDASGAELIARATVAAHALQGIIQPMANGLDDRSSQNPALSCRLKAELIEPSLPRRSSGATCTQYAVTHGRLEVEKKMLGETSMVAPQPSHACHTHVVELPLQILVAARPQGILGGTHEPSTPAAGVVIRPDNEQQMPD